MSDESHTTGYDCETLATFESNYIFEELIPIEWQHNQATIRIDVYPTKTDRKETQLLETHAVLKFEIASSINADIQARVDIIAQEAFNAFIQHLAFTFGHAVHKVRVHSVTVTPRTGKYRFTIYAGVRTAEMELVDKVPERRVIHANELRTLTPSFSPEQQRYTNMYANALRLQPVEAYIVLYGILQFTFDKPGQEARQHHVEAWIRRHYRRTEPMDLAPLREGQTRQRSESQITRVRNEIGHVHDQADRTIEQSIALAEQRLPDLKAMVRKRILEL